MTSSRPLERLALSKLHDLEMRDREDGHHDGPQFQSKVGSFRARIKATTRIVHSSDQVQSLGFLSQNVICRPKTDSPGYPRADQHEQPQTQCRSASILVSQASAKQHGSLSLTLTFIIMMAMQPSLNSHHLRNSDWHSRREWLQGVCPSFRCPGLVCPRHDDQGQGHEPQGDLPINLKPPPDWHLLIKHPTLIYAFLDGLLQPCSRICLERLKI